MSQNDFSHCDVWTRMYKGLFIKIHRSHQLGNVDYHIKPKDLWCYYISFNKDRLEESIFNLVTAGIKETEWFSCNYQDSPLSNLNWHHGCTYGKLIRNHNAELHVIELGCDYDHYWDEGFDYCFEYVENEAMATVDDFIDRYPTAIKELNK